MAVKQDIVNSDISEDANIYSGVRISGSKIESGVIVGDESRITESYLRYNVEIARRNNIKYSYIDEGSYTGENTVIHNAKIGKYCCISWNVTIGGGEHHLNSLSLTGEHRIFREKRPNVNKFLFEEDLTIGNDVWIAAGVNILRGCTIGDGAVCGAGAVVTKDVPPYAIVVGVPAKIIGFRFSNDVIKRLLDLKWWDLPVELLRKCETCFAGDFSLEKLKHLDSLKSAYFSCLDS